ncbi:Hypothetical protein A7982_04530 [Minicystis rosea]|nr:Hypothetical protein A7982_04530 [Minicystis rosea]
MDFGMEVSSTSALAVVDRHRGSLKPRRWLQTKCLVLQRSIPRMLTA